MSGKEKLIVILGPTAVGKTDLSIELAQKLNTEIISGDSMLVYRGFDIGSAKPSLEEREGVPHHLIDIREPNENYAVTDFVAGAKKHIRELNAQGKVPILAGGTGLYIKALLEGYQFNETEEHGAYRSYLEELGRSRGKEYVHGLLAAADPAAAQRLHPNDFRRVVRALEVSHFGGEQISQERQAGAGEITRASLCYDALVIGLERDRQELYERINRRYEVRDIDLVSETVCNGVRIARARKERIKKALRLTESAHECERQEEDKDTVDNYSYGIGPSLLLEEQETEYRGVDLDARGDSKTDKTDLAYDLILGILHEDICDKECERDDDYVRSLKLIKERRREQDKDYKELLHNVLELGSSLADFKSLIG